MTALRGGAMSGKLLFVVFAASYMSEVDFGRWGIIASMTLALVAVAGLEAYQLFIRAITQSTGEEADLPRRTYSTFALVAPLVSGTAAFLLGLWMNWGMHIAVMVGVLVALEHLGIEAFRILIAESRASLATLNLFLRSGSWAFALPLLTLAGVTPETWSLELVLSFWLVAALFALLPFAKVLKAYIPNWQSMMNFLPAMHDIIRQVLPWIVGIVAWRLLENGGRFVIAAVEGEAAAGRFTLISMLAIVNLLLAKGIIEPIFLARLMAGTDQHTTRSFRRSLLLMIVLGSAASILCGIAYDAYVASLTTAEMWSLIIMTGAFGAMAISVSGHIELYRAHQDHRLAAINAAALIVGVFVSIPGAHLAGLPGAAIGILAGCITLAVLKELYARRLNSYNTV